MNYFGEDCKRSNYAKFSLLKKILKYYGKRKSYFPITSITFLLLFNPETILQGPYSFLKNFKSVMFALLFSGGAATEIKKESPRLPVISVFLALGLTISSNLINF